MTCQDYRAMASVWFDGESDAHEFDDLVEHLHGCPTCRAFLGRIPRQSAALRSFPAGLGTGVHDHAAPRGFASYSLNAPLAVAAAIILVILTIAVQGNLRGTSAYDMDRPATPPPSVGVTR